MKRALLLLPLLGGVYSSTLVHAQVLPPAQAQPAGQPAAAPASEPPAEKKKDPLLGGAAPFLDPGSETATWDGKMWNVTNNRVFRARLEKYLATPEADGPEDQLYREVLQKINETLAPTHNGGKPDLPGAVALLPLAATHPIDAKLCDSLANAIYGVWLSQKNVVNLRATNDQMKRQVNDRHFFGEKAEEDLTSRANVVSAGAGGGKGKAAPPSPKQQAAQLGQAAQYVKDIVEFETKMKANELAMGTAQVTAKLEFQALIIQFALQRRFEHVVMACRFYRHIFSDPSGVLQLQKGSDAEKMFGATFGTAPTVGAMDSFANEAIRDVDEGVRAFDQLLERGDMYSASQRISEAFMVGEYLPRIRRVPMSQKLKVLDFTRDGNKLISAIEVKDYTTANQLVTKLKIDAKDFDASKPQAAIEAARIASEMTLNKAKVAAMQGDQKASAEALRAAAEIWPTNPRLAEFTNMIGVNSDVKAQAILDLDRNLSQRNYRQIYNDQGRYLAAVTDDPGRLEQLKQVLKDVTKVNLVIGAATSLSQQSNMAGAWETIEKSYKDFPDDPEVARLRSDLSVKATDFVSALERGRQHEERKQMGSALAWYLKAKSQYPPSEFAGEGIKRLVDKLHGTTNLQ